MLATERPADGTAEWQAIVCDTAQVQALVAAMQAGEPVDFRAIHPVASRMTQTVELNKR